jgi:hypothetical protein
MIVVATARNRRLRVQRDERREVWPKHAEFGAPVTTQLDINKREPAVASVRRGRLGGHRSRDADALLQRGDQRRATPSGIGSTPSI